MAERVSFIKWLDECRERYHDEGKIKIDFNEWNSRYKDTYDKEFPWDWTLIEGLSCPECGKTEPFAFLCYLCSPIEEDSFVCSSCGLVFEIPPKDHPIYSDCPDPDRHDCCSVWLSKREGEWLATCSWCRTPLCVCGELEADSCSSTL